MVFRGWLIFALFCLIGGAVYANAINNPFHYDDLHHITTNPHIRGLSNIPIFFTDSKTFTSVKASRGKGFHYRPLVMVTYAVNYAVSHLDPAGYHLVNLAFHVGTAFLVFLIVKAMLKGMGIASMAAGLIFLLHPFNSEVVNYISARSSVMSGFFYLLAFYCWVKFRSKKLEDRSKMVFSNFLPLTSNFYLFSLLAFVAGMLSKEVVITLPLVLWLYDIYFGGRTTQASLGHPKPAASSAIPYLPFVLIVVVPYLVVRASWLSETLSHSRRDMGTQLFTELPVLIKHWQMFLIPTPLTPIHEAAVYRTFWFLPVVYSSLILLAYITVALFLLRRSSHSGRVVSFFMIWFLIVLLPTTIVPLGLIFQEHRAYLAMVSFVVIAGIALEEGKRFKGREGALVLLVVLLTIYSAVIVVRNRVWKDDLTLWSDTVRKSPDSPIAYTGLGIAYKDRGMFDQSITAFNKALTYDSDGEEIMTARHNLAQIHIVQKKLDLAAQELEDLLKTNPNNAQLHSDIGIVYGILGKEDLAEQHFYASIKMEPMSPLAYFNLGVLYSNQGRLDEAVRAYQNVLSLTSDHMEARFRLGMAFEELGKKNEAAEQYRYILQKAMNKNDALAREAQERLNRLLHHRG